MGQSSGKNIRL